MCRAAQAHPFAPAGRLFGTVLEEGIVVTTAANLMTLPLVAYNFGRVSVVSLLTNLLIVPAQPLITLGGTAAVAVGLVGSELPARMLLWLPWLGLVWTVDVVEWTAAMPYANQAVAGYGFGAMAVTFLAIFVMSWHGQLWHALQELVEWVRIDLLARLASPMLASAMAVSAALVWSAVVSLPDGRLHVWFLDVGQGDGILIQTPGGRQVLIDGGPNQQVLFDELGAVMPFWDRSIDLVVLTHPDGDHMAAQIETPSRFAIADAWATAASEASKDSALWRDRMQAVGVKVHIQYTGGWVDLGDGVALWVLSPPAADFSGDNADNDNSLVTKLVYGDFGVLLTGDAGTAAETQLIASHAPVQSTVLKVGHHGSNTSTSAAFLKVVNPSIAVIQVGKSNKFGHPNAELLDPLAGRMVLRTDIRGRIELRSDGRQMWIETQK